MYGKSSACLDHKNVDISNFSIMYLGLIEAIFTNFISVKQYILYTRQVLLCPNHDVAAA